MYTNTRKLKTMGYGQFHLKTILSHLRGVAENVETFFNILLKQSVSQYSDCNSDHDSSGFSLHLSVMKLPRLIAGKVQDCKIGAKFHKDTMT